MKKGFLVALISMIFFVSPVLACVDGPEGTNCAEDLTTVKTENGAVAYADINASYDENANGSVLLAGNFVDYTGTADGIVFMAGNNVTAKGSGEYALYAGNNIDVLGDIEKDAFIAGNIINVRATIGRDVFIAGSNVTLSGTISRDITIFASNVILDNVSISGDAKIYAEMITIKDDVNIDGKLTYSATEANISSDAIIGSQEKIDMPEINVTYMDTIKSRIMSYASILLVFIVFALLIPVSLKNVGDDKLSFLQIVTYIGYALVFLILVPVACIFLLMLEIGAPLALMIIGLYIAAIYLSYMYMGYYIGKKIWLSKNKEENLLLEGLIGITILYVIALIPTIGAIVSIIAHLCGLGIIIFKFKK